MEKQLALEVQCVAGLVEMAATLRAGVSNNTSVNRYNFKDQQHLSTHFEIFAKSSLR